ncbi:GT2 family glycosyltransferase [Sediminihabitans luteus]|uniref:GT2 family glycosyltransferase n=1 Tax=Sediminihabitans luteus TaxID=1138585 RepID=A0A2M9CD44_9CELL|nr:glycosyltransferase [Sediminihabitans luteus]PJJ69270.1 GT2 family glycosyltransferase [Sediminihabitans luteus]GII98947.1 glycosyl transferase [Sediminihabitans luteus]
MSTPTISVVIPTYNRAELLRHTLEALRRQTLPRDRFEVVVVDDGGSDDAEAVVRSFSQDLDVKYFWQEDLGFRAGKARNIGTAIASGTYVVYIDTGVLLATDTLATHLATHEASEYPTVMIGYVYGFEIDDATVATLMSTIEHDDTDASIEFLHAQGALDIREQQYAELGENITSWPAPFDIFWTCHVSAEREELLKAGLFDESFTSWGGEDVDLGVRLFQRNNLFLMDRAARSLHWPHAKEVSDLKESSASAAERIHSKYNLWTTSFYGKDLQNEKYSLNKVIKISRERESLRLLSGQAR